MRERRELLCHYLQAIGDGVTNYSISDWAVNHLLLELIQLGHQEQSIAEVVNAPDKYDLKFPRSIKMLEEELVQDKVFA
jgi:hypothetical protein